VLSNDNPLESASEYLNYPIDYNHGLSWINASLWVE